MQEDRYLEIFITLSKLGPNLKEIILLKLNEKILNKEIQGKMIKNKKTKILTTFLYLELLQII